MKHSKCQLAIDFLKQDQMPPKLQQMVETVVTVETVRSIHGRAVLDKIRSASPR